MRILVRQDDFSARLYELHLGEGRLFFSGDVDSFSLPFKDMQDFCITENDSGKSWFSMIGNGKMHEGQILDAENANDFARELQRKLGGSTRLELKLSR